MQGILQRADIIKFTKKKKLRLSLYGRIEGITKEKMTKLIVTARMDGTRKKVDHGEAK
jgi:hypothetical protein